MQDDKIHIGMIEDNKVISNNVSSFLIASNEAEVKHIAISAEAYIDFLKANKSFKPDVLLLDIGLPGISGIEAIPELKKLQPDTDIIMLTTFEEEELIVKALCLGAVGYISKKSSLADILKAIKIVFLGGSYMSPQIAREISNYFIKGQVKKQSLLELSKRKKEILELLVNGDSYQEIADTLSISVETVRSHIKKLYKELHVKNKTEAISMHLNNKL